MKRMLALYFVLCLITPPVFAKAKRVALTASIQNERKTAIVARIRKVFPKAYANLVVNDPRFTFNLKIVAKIPPEEKPKPRKHDYAYIGNKWSKTHGLQFLKDNEPVLQITEAQLHVPKEIITGVFDAETQYGEVPRGDRVIVQSLLTLAIFRPNFQRPGWPEDELIMFLRLCEQYHWDVFTETGSRTGARGKAQFEPTSYEMFAMHYDGNQCVSGKTSLVPPDLFDNADAICSIGNYLHGNGWGKSETSRVLALYSYNRDHAYGRAILNVADFFRAAIK